jgi:hypothetical protein
LVAHRAPFNPVALEHNVPRDDRNCPDQHTYEALDQIYKKLEFKICRFEKKKK